MGVQQDLNRRASKDLASSTPSSGSAWSRPDPRRASHGDWPGADGLDGGVRRATGLPRRVINTPSPSPPLSTCRINSRQWERNWVTELSIPPIEWACSGLQPGCQGLHRRFSSLHPCRSTRSRPLLAGVTSGSSEAAAAIAQQKEATSKGEGGRDHAQGCFDQAGSRGRVPQWRRHW